LLSLTASVLFVVRGFAVEGTAERTLSPVLFGTFGVLWLAAYRSSVHRRND
jgi:hypothetical protein